MLICAMCCELGWFFIIAGDVGFWNLTQHMSPSRGNKKKMGAKTSKRYEIEDVAKKLKDGEFNKVIFMVSASVRAKNQCC
jgi:hypothetical protein